MIKINIFKRKEVDKLKPEELDLNAPRTKRSITISVNGATLTSLEKLQTKLGIPFYAVVRMALNEYLTRQLSSK